MTKTKKTYKKPAVIALAAVIVLFLGWKTLRTLKPASGKGTGNTAVAVEIASITKGSLRDIASHTGALAAKTRVVVAPKIAGRLNRLRVDIGDPVSSGQLLVVLEDEEYRQQVIQAEADLNVTTATLKEAKSALTVAANNLERARALHQTGIQSDAQLDQVEAEYQSQMAKVSVAEAQLANRQSALANARLLLSYTRITASWDRGGPVRYVGERFVDEGALLSINTPILSIIDLQPLTAVINVTDQEYFSLQAGQSATVTSTAFPEKRFSGRIDRIAPLLQEGSRQARVEIEVENRELFLKPGMFVNIRIELARKDNVTIAPFNALAKRNGEQGVFLVDMTARSARFQPVETGIIEKDRVEIVKPKDISGHVVVMGHYLLEKEGRIILPEPASESSADMEPKKAPVKEDKQ
ncbi:MAG: efflux RND transporter periplasmic adaptor subunit [Vicinamibacteria bacterium]|nr:efflux RND transporter periplasmic adaptor subunit [Vicinamibacteria bacterium]